jgi:hypothetical protein
MRQLLIDEGLVTPGLLETCTAMLNANKHIPPSQIIHSFGQLFHIDFGSNNLFFSILSMNQLRRHHYASIFSESEEWTDHSRIRIRTHTAPYLGEYQCCIFHANTA